jgi:hypothetical protein
MLTDRIRLTTDAAYVPWVSFSGLDDAMERKKAERPVPVAASQNSLPGTPQAAPVQPFVSDETFSWREIYGGDVPHLFANERPRGEDYNPSPRGAAIRNDLFVDR